MPIYEIACKKCGNKQEIFRSVSKYNDLPECCGEIMHRCLTAPEVMSDIQPYKSQATGEYITSRSKHREHLKAHGLVEIGDQHKAHQKQIERRKEEQKKKDSVALRQEIAARLDSIPTKK